MISPRIAFLDVDGTIIDSGETIADSTIDAIKTARRNGHLVYLSTGRASIEIYPSIRDIGFDGAITAGGGFATVGDELVIARTMPTEAVSRMVSFYEESGYDFYLQAYNELFPSPGVRGRFAAYLRDDLARKRASRPDLAAATLAETAPAREVALETELEQHPALQTFGDVRPLSYTGIAKSVFLGSDFTAFDRVSEALSEDFHVITGTIPHMGGGSGEVTLNGVNKGSTILQLLELLNLDATSAIGIGDSSNDVEMLQVCGVGIAMGNATDSIKAHADEVTTSVLDDGIWNAFRRHGLI